jgi:hypothetical protein
MMSAGLESRILGVALDVRNRAFHKLAGAQNFSATNPSPRCFTTEMKTGGNATDSALPERCGPQPFLLRINTAFAIPWRYVTLFSMACRELRAEAYGCTARRIR